MTLNLSYSSLIPQPSSLRHRRPFRASCWLVVAALLCLSTGAGAQKKPKPALKEKDARRAIANTPGLALKTGAVRVRDISAAGATPVVVLAEVTTAFRFKKGEDKKEGDDSTLSASTVAEPKWRLAEVRTGDRSWEEIDFLVTPLGAEKINRARAALESLAAEFETQQRERKSDDEIVRDNLRIKQFSPLGSSAVAEVGVEASFRLERGDGGKWRVAEVTIGGESSGELNALLASVNAQKNERARAELAEITAALESFRRERGFYIVAKDEAVLIDHLSPRYVKRVIRIDPWHRPYRYEGTRDGYVLRSDGADGAAGTPDDISIPGKSS
ncbi:MAG: type II secretion system protein GspG [Acidobacteria bacterium]|nr:type II secretion system protein GspG [Acidobacteriota bacterium]